MASASDTAYLIGPLLKDVSRSFYLTLRVLPSSLRLPISLAYLLARATDTIADTKLVSRPVRRECLGALKEMILSHVSHSGLDKIHRSMPASMQQPAERILLEKLGDCLRLLADCGEEDREEIRKVLTTIIHGQDLDLERFGESVRELRPLQTAAELDEYTYLVAGCVGEFWTRLCLMHLDKLSWDADKMIATGIHFGKGLQLTNILRDIPGDLRQGRCYLPFEELKPLGLFPTDLLEGSNFEKVRPVYETWRRKGLGYLEEGWSYTMSYPGAHWRLRLACAWPVLIGFQTLHRLGSPQANPLDSSKRIKVSRGEVRSILFGSLIRVWSGTALDRYGRRFFS